jgi:predicted lipoprotein with Yx(FWY)xxD motif
MFRPVHRQRRLSALVLVATGLAAAAFVTAAFAASFTLKLAKHATVTNVKHVTTHPNVVANAKGMVVYTLSGDSRHHPQCTSKKCLRFWPPVTVKSAKQLSRATGVKGNLGTWRHNGFLQVTLDGHPLYTFLGDTKRGVATGEGIANFGGVWHVRMASPAGATTTAPPVGGGPGGY